MNCLRKADEAPIRFTTSSLLCNGQTSHAAPHVAHKSPAGWPRGPCSVWMMCFANQGAWKGIGNS
eukprot:9840418-Alexandrium_andersonii.AAC.1